MGKHMRREQAGIAFEKNVSGCGMWSILQLLDYNQWHNVKKRLPYRRHGSCGRRAMEVGNPGKDINITNADEVQEHIVAEMDKSAIGKKIIKSNQTSKGSGKARIRALIAKEMSKRKGQHHRSPSYPTKSQLTRTDSIHRLEYADKDLLAEMISSDESPSLHQNNENPSHASTVKLMPVNAEEPIAGNKNCEAYDTTVALNCLGNRQMGKHGKKLVENQMPPEKTRQVLSEQKLLHAKDIPGVPQSKELLDALSIINMNREFFLKVLQDPESPWTYHFQNQQARSVKFGLSKSESFPAAGVSRGRDFGPIEAKYKQKEIMSYARAEGKSQVGSEMQELAKVQSAEDGCGQSMCGIADDSSPGSPHLLKHQSESQVAIKRFKDLKQKIKHAIRESKKERRRITMDAIFHKVPHGHRFSKDAKKEIADQLKDPAINKKSTDGSGIIYEKDHSNPALSRQISFPHKSLERYTQLFESSFNKEAKQHISERLKLRTEELELPRSSAPKSLGRILSLPDFKSSFGFHSEDSCDYLSGSSINTVEDGPVRTQTSSKEQKSPEFPLGSENHIQFDALGEIQKHLVEANEIYPDQQDQVRSTLSTNSEANAVGWTNNDLEDLTIRDTAFCEGTQLTEPGPIPLLDSKFQHIASPAEFSALEDSKSERKGLLPDELDSALYQQHESRMDSPTVGECRFDLEKEEILRKPLDGNFLPVLIPEKDKAEFNYVRDVLDLSGFSRNEFLGAWDSSDQPVGPSVFDEMEGCSPGLEYLGNEEDGSCNHLLLFDLINEVLLEIYERSFSYCPMNLCSLCHIRPVPVGYRVLEEVWANISWYLNWEPDPDLSLDYTVSRDISKGDGWMNLQFEAECIGLELEDWIFDDLLDELFYS